MALSRERIADELLKLLGVVDPSRTIEIMLGRAILRPVLPEIERDAAKRLRDVIAAERDAAVTADPLRRLAALLPRDPAIVEGVAARLRLSNKAKRRLVCAAEPELQRTAQALAYRCGAECAVDRLLLAGRCREAAEIADWRPPRLPIGGGALIERGLPEGPIVARTLRRIEDIWVSAGFPSGPDFERIVDEALTAAR
jgi:poly(A) polymerase